MRKFISAALTAAITASMLVISYSPAVTADSSEWNDNDIMPLLDSLGIMQGDGNGNYFLDDYVSREEMAKISVNSSAFKDETAVGIRVSPFKDIDPSRWSAAYILNGTRNGLFNGYLDGTFKPYDMVTYEEAVTMMLKVLGYTDNYFGISYPYGQINVAKNIDLIENINSDYGQWMTRRQIARLVYNALNTEIKGTGAASKLISIFDASILEDAVLLSTEKEGSNGKIYIRTGTGSVKYNVFDGFNYDYVGMQGDAVIRNGKDMLCFVPDTSSISKYVIYSLLNDAVIGYNNGVMTQIDVKDDTTCYKDTAAYTYAQIKSGLEMGDVIKVKYDNAGSVDYVMYEKGNMEGPTKVTSSDMVNSYIKDSSTQVMRDGNKVTASSVQLNDVIYYSADLNMVLAYSNKVTGIYESASPSRDQPNKVTISGKEYNVESVQAFNDLSSSGPFKYGDTITVILGKGGDVAGVVTNASLSKDTSYGYAVSTGRKNFSNNDGTTYSSYYIDIIAPDGSNYEYATEYDCSSYINSVVKASFTNGQTSITKVSGSSSGGVSGTVNIGNMTIGKYKLADDCKILDTVGYYTTDMPLYKSIYAQRLDGVNITSGKVRYYAKNARDEITELILWDVTGDCYSYGIVTGGSSETNYKVDIDGISYTTSYSAGAYVSTPCKAYFKGASLELEGTIKSYGSVSKLTQSTATIGNTEYLLSDKVVVYTGSNTTSFNKISINDVINGNYSCTAYYDKKESEGGRIRIIISTPKK